MLRLSGRPSWEVEGCVSHVGFYSQTLRVEQKHDDYSAKASAETPTQAAKARPVCQTRVKQRTIIINGT